MRREELHCMGRVSGVCVWRSFSFELSINRRVCVCITGVLRVVIMFALTVRLSRFSRFCCRICSNWLFRNEARWRESEARFRRGMQVAGCRRRRAGVCRGLNKLRIVLVVPYVPICVLQSVSMCALRVDWSVWTSTKYVLVAPSRGTVGGPCDLRV